ncbi:HAD superfamily (subfamily IA) hydrolase, TIGR02253 [Methanococcus vannielii SB]|jgi:putative hydrolase of the HAD superfamily|uniref:Glyceraldehyde 3-phosphate phosphatase n=1 Tax=Methanococcus vannielii (strain ATCC 35089 / DSM 1224 / JCM 13029 / OCM 148 / SB) TaxID=406327 RepID=A6UNT7_METVS|nr:TIGR02253 family HAD-type hydrolase [Methanococcus vannielii]ABR54159.1 HAD superfamily (subfamily IA) hydrolase, TIGR02253 [Methanococcus vannielii SB]
MIRGVLFDLDDTLYNSSSFANRARKEALRAMIDAGLDSTEENAQKVLNKIIDQKGSNYGMHFNDLVKDIMGVHDPKIITMGIITYHNVKFALLRPYSDTIKTLVDLRTMGLKLGILTDGVTIKQWEKLIRLGIHPLFDEVVTSEEFGLGKPNTEFFNYGLKKLKLNPEEVVYVGDRVDRDIIPAKSVGIRTVRILQGKYSSVCDETSDYTIKNISELSNVIKKMI